MPWARTDWMSERVKFVAALGESEPSLATLTCARCRTMLSIRFVAEEPAG